MVQNLDILRYSKDESLVSNTNDANLKAIIETTQTLLQFKTNVKIETISILLRLIRSKLKKRF